MLAFPIVPAVAEAKKEFDIADDDDEAEDLDDDDDKVRSAAWLPTSKYGRMAERDDDIASTASRAHRRLAHPPPVNDDKSSKGSDGCERPLFSPIADAEDEDDGAMGADACRCGVGG